MKIPLYVKDLISRLEDGGFAAFTVGGCVRDSLLGRTPSDWDICTAATPEEVMRLFSDCTVIPTGVRHGTVTLVLPHAAVEITTFRKDGSYRDARHPDSVTFTTDILEDLKRRDFTFNAMAYASRRGLIDPFGGQADLKNGVLRCVGCAEERFSEDALRILRALRFAAVYGFSIEPLTASAIHTCCTALPRIAAERILSELEKMLCGRHIAEVLFRFPDVYAILFPQSGYPLSASACDDWASFVQVLGALPPSLPLRLAVLFSWKVRTPSDSIPLCRQNLLRLKCSNSLKRQTLELAALLFEPLPCNTAAMRRLVGQYGADAAALFLQLKNVQALSGSETAALALVQSNMQALRKIQEENLCCTISELAICGRDLINAGAKPGPGIRILLHAALDAVIENKAKNEKNALLDFLFSEMPLQFTP